MGEDFASLLNRLLQKHDRSANWLASKIGVAASTVSRSWLAEGKTPRSPDLVAKIVEAFSIKDEHEKAALFRAAGFYYAATSADADSLPSKSRIEPKLPEMEVLPTLSEIFTNIWYTTKRYKFWERRDYIIGHLEVGAHTARYVGEDGKTIFIENVTGVLHIRQNGSVNSNWVECGMNVMDTPMLPILPMVAGWD